MKIKKTRRPPGSSVSDPRPHNIIRSWRIVPDSRLRLYARSFHTAAKKLATAPEVRPGTFTDFDPCPVVFLYRHAVELHLKALVLGDGSSFLPVRPDRISVSKTVSLSWLGQFVCQIVTILHWEDKFKCEGIESLADFSAILEDVNSVDPGPHGFRYPVDTEDQETDPDTVPFSVAAFARRMDALVGLLDATADALSTTWDLHARPAFLSGNESNPIIQ